MSRGFRFRLDVVLQQRERQEQAAQLALAQALRAQAQAQTAAEHLRRRLEAEQREGTEPGSAFDAERRMHLLLHTDRATRQLEQQQRLVAQRAQEVQRMRALLQQASVHKRALERLRERQQREFTREQERRMNQELDEYGTLGYVRLSRERMELDAPVVEY